MSDRDDLQDLTIEGATYRTRLTRKWIHRKPFAPRNPRHVLAYIPGTIVEVLVEPGQSVARGDALVILEAMKMRNSITAPTDGSVKALLVEVGRLVDKGELLVELD